MANTSLVVGAGFGQVGPGLIELCLECASKDGWKRRSLGSLTVVFAEKPQQSGEFRRNWPVPKRPYKQEVGGSTPSAPKKKDKPRRLSVSAGLLSFDSLSRCVQVGQ